MEKEETADGHILRKWVSLGDVISLAFSLTALGVTYGSLSSDVRHTNETVEAVVKAVEELQARDITPGARTQLAAIQATDAALQQQVNELREENRDFRRELLEEMRSISNKLDNHMERSR